MSYHNYCIRPYISLHFIYNDDTQVNLIDIPARYLENKEYLFTDDFKDWCYKQVNSIHIEVYPKQFYCALHLLLENCKSGVVIGEGSNGFKSAIDNMLELVKHYV